MDAVPSTHDTPEGKRRKPFRGVFSSQTFSYVGFGATKRKVKQNVFVFVEEQADGSYRSRNLNKHYIPSGAVTALTRETLLADYLPEPDIYMNKVMPMLRRLRKTVDAADAHREQGELMSAEFEYKNALRVDEEHIRATFGLGLTYLDRGEIDNANLVCRRIITLDASFDEEHKHVFNEFGIKMRKHKMYAQALRYYFKAYRLAKNDENLLYNISRTYYEKRKIKLARKFLDMALVVNPAFAEAETLSDAIDRKAGRSAPPADTP